MIIELRGFLCYFYSVSSIVDSDVRPGDLTVGVAVATAASSLIQPGHGSVVVTPVGHNNGHTLAESVIHRPDISAVVARIKLEGVTVLSVFGVDLAILEGGALGELSVGIDSLAGTEGVGVSIPGVGAATTSVASADGGASSLPALVRSGSNNIFVSFHDVHFPAPDATNLVSITVVVTTRARVGLPRPVEARHAHSVESSVARARDAVEVNVEGESLVFEDILVIVVRVQVVISIGSDVSSSVVSKGN